MLDSCAEYVPLVKFIQIFIDQKVKLLQQAFGMDYFGASSRLMHYNGAY